MLVDTEVYRRPHINTHHNLLLPKFMIYLKVKKVVDPDQMSNEMIKHGVE